MDLQGPDADFMILVVSVQPVIGGGRPFRHQSNVVAEGLQTHLDFSDTPFQGLEPNFQGINTGFQAIKPGFQGIKAPIHLAEFPGKKGDQFRVLVSGHQVPWRWWSLQGPKIPWDLDRDHVRMGQVGSVGCPSVQATQSTIPSPGSPSPRGLHGNLGISQVKEVTGQFFLPEKYSLHFFPGRPHDPALVRHPVSDFAHWKKAYDEFTPERSGMGVKAHAAYQAVDDDNDVTVWHDFESMESAQAFMGSPRLKEVIESAGVAGESTIWFTRGV